MDPLETRPLLVGSDIDKEHSYNWYLGIKKTVNTTHNDASEKHVKSTWYER